MIWPIGRVKAIFFIRPTCIHEVVCIAMRTSMLIDSWVCRTLENDSAQANKRLSSLEVQTVEVTHLRDQIDTIRKTAEAKDSEIFEVPGPSPQFSNRDVLIFLQPR